MIKNIVLAASLALSLGACSTLGGARNVEISCAAAAAALETLTEANDQGKLSPDAQAKVLDAAERVEPVCSADEKPTLDSVKAEAINQAVAALLELAAKYKE